MSQFPGDKGLMSVLKCRDCAEANFKRGVNQAFGEVQLVVEETEVGGGGIGDLLQSLLKRKLREARTELIENPDPVDCCQKLPQTKKKKRPCLDYGPLPDIE